MNYLGVFAKYWQPGQVKTRLAKSIGAGNASKLYQHFLIHLLSRCSAICAAKALWYWPEHRAGEFQDLIARFQLSRRDWTLRPQIDGDLGQRMSNFFGQTFAVAPLDSGKQINVVLIGSDAPHLPGHIYQDAFAALESGTSDVVVGPSEDGGYYLIGMRNRTLPVFDAMPWSTNRLLDATLELLGKLNVAVHILPICSDIDVLDDLEKVRLKLASKSNADSLDQQLIVQIDRALGNTQMYDE